MDVGEPSARAITFHHQKNDAFVVKKQSLLRTRRARKVSSELFNRFLGQ
jgi:hypothetical protein